MIKNLLLPLALSGLLAGSALAQNPYASGAGPGVYDPGHPRVNQVNRRERNQQYRIANGIKNGQLTPRETARLEGREHRLVHNERRDMAKDGGHLTRRNQARLNHEANRVSRGIYRDKHNRAFR
jgi:hypothetical protein